jgi:hypothetical protein
MRCTIHRWFVGPALIVLLASAGLEAEGLVRSQQARAALRPAIKNSARSRHRDEEGRFFRSVEEGLVRRGHDASAAHALMQHAEKHPSAHAWHLASLALTWDGERERAAARAASRAARLSPADSALARAEDAAIDALTWAEIREVSRPAGAVAGGVVVLGLLGWLGRRAHARYRCRWIDGLRARVVAAADGQPATTGSDLAVVPGTQSLAFDVFLDGAGPLPARHGPTLSVVLSHRQDSRTIRLTPVKDVRQDALRVRLSETSLGEVLAHAGPWRVSVALDGKHVGETGLLVLGRQAARLTR